MRRRVTNALYWSSSEALRFLSEVNSSWDIVSDTWRTRVCICFSLIYLWNLDGAVKLSFSHFHVRRFWLLGCGNIVLFRTVPWLSFSLALAKIQPARNYYGTILLRFVRAHALARALKHRKSVFYCFARVFYISLVFSNARRVLSQCNTRLRLLYLLNKT